MEVLSFDANCAKFSYLGIVMLCGVRTAQALRLFACVSLSQVSQLCSGWMDGLWEWEGKYRRPDLTLFI